MKCHTISFKIEQQNNEEKKGKQMIVQVFGTGQDSTMDERNDVGRDGLRKREWEWAEQTIS
jgi:hypothetical protein